MTRIINFALVAAFVTTLAACASQPVAQDAQSYQPPRAKLDAKTQLETGRTYR